MKKKQIQCVGDPIQRFAEDALRILRLFRFVARYHFSVEENTGVAASLQKEGLLRISRERIGAELRGIFTAGYSGEALKSMEKTSVFAILFPFAPSEKTLALLDELPKDFSLRMAFFLRDGCGGGSPETISDFFGKRFALTKKEQSEIAQLLEWIQWDMEDSFISVKSCLFQSGEELTGKYADYRRVYYGAGDSFSQKLGQVIANGDCYAVKDLAVSGRDLLEIGVPENETLGILLQELLEMVWETPEKNEKENLLREARRRFSEFYV